MVTANADGDGCVRFGTGETVAVPRLSDARPVRNTSLESLPDGVWLPVLEDAVSRKLVVRYGNDTPADVTGVWIGGTSPGAVIRLFCGKNVPVYVLRNVFGRDSTMASLARDMAEALSGRRIVVATMWKEPPAGTARIPGLVYSHAYAITAFDTVAGRVTLWNPWGDDFTPAGPEGPANGYRTVHGEFTVPLADLHDRFGNVYIEPR